MSYIVLEESLINEFFKFYYNKNFNPDIIQKIFNHFKPFLVTNEQIIRYFENDKIAIQQALSSQIPYCKYIDTTSKPYTDDFYKEMLEKSKYKILLTKHSSSLNHLDYHKICIQDNATHIFANELKSGNSRDNAKKHIFSLIKNANQITIIDRFLYKVDVINKLVKWFNENELNKSIKISLKGNGDLTCDEVKTTFKQKGYNEIHPYPIENTIHDRYIIVDDNISINLTSGLENLFNIKKDFTYIISEK